MAAEMFRVGERVDVGDLEDALEIIQTILEGDEEREEVIAYACTEGLAEKIVWMLDQGLQLSVQQLASAAAADPASRLYLHRPVTLEVRYRCSNCGHREERIDSGADVYIRCTNCGGQSHIQMCKAYNEQWTPEQEALWRRDHA